MGDRVRPLGAGQAGAAAARRQGVALFQILLFAGITVLFLLAGSQFVFDTLKEGRTTRRDSQLYNVALSGLNHAVAWLKRQPFQPAPTFDPVATGLEADETADTPAADEQLGLAHEYELDAAQQLWARYEVGRSSNAPVRGSVAQVGAHDARYPSGITWVAEDIGRQRGKLPGAAWLLRCRGYIFSKKNGQTFDTDPARRELTLEAEVPFVTPRYRQAALYGFSSNATTLTASAANALRLDVLDGSGRPYWLRTTSVVESGSVDYGAAPFASLSGQADASSTTHVDAVAANQWVHLFGTSELSAIRALAGRVADLSAGDPLPVPMPTQALTYIVGNPTFDADHPASGSGILMVEGNLTIDGDTTEQIWRGLIVTTGTYTQRDRSTVHGGVIAGGAVTLEGDTAKEAELRYSQAELELAMASLRGYRLDYSTVRVLEGVSTPSPL